MLDERNRKSLEQGNTKVLLSEDYLKMLHHFTRLERKIRIYPVIPIYKGFKIAKTIKNFLVIKYPYIGYGFLTKYTLPRDEF